MMSPQSILAGKTYRTAAGEILQVKSIEGGDVVFTAATAPHGVGVIGKSTPQRLALSQFAQDVENEVI